MVSHVRNINIAILHNQLNDKTNQKTTRSFGCVMYEMTELKHLFNNKKAQIIVDILKFEEVNLRLEKALPVFQAVLKK